MAFRKIKKIKMKTQLEQIITRNFLNDDYFNQIEEYKETVSNLYNILKGRKKGSIKSSFSKVQLLGFDAIIIFVKLNKATEDSIIDFEELEQYEICSILRDFNELIKNQIYDEDQTR